MAVGVAALANFVLTRAEGVQVSSPAGVIGGGDLRTIKQFHERGRGSTTPGVNAARYALDRARSLSHLGAITCLDPDCDQSRALGLLSSPLYGVPMVVSDSIDTVDLPTTAGTPALARRIPPADAPAVRRLRAAGAIVIGKSAQHELALGGSSENPYSGTPRNPLDMSMTTGGSSGGGAAAVAAGIVPMALGTDTAGSVRVPAAFCGLVGFRPSSGRYPSEGLVPISPTRDVVGPITRTVQDLLLVDAALTGRGPVPDTVNLSQTRLAINPDHLRGLDPVVRSEFRCATASLELAGVTFVDVDMRELERAGERAGHTILNYEFVPALRCYLAARYPGLTVERLLDQVASVDVRAAVGYIRALRITQEEYSQALADRIAVSEAMAWQLDGIGAAAVLHPTSPVLPGPIDAPDEVFGTGVHVPAYVSYLRFSGIAGAVNLPAVTIPSGAEWAGTPVGIELRGITRRDDNLLALAAAISDVLRYYSID